ncbi:MAG: endopeptidase La, partial [Candidatus Zixiibacteriota bacterium]
MKDIKDKPKTENKSKLHILPILPVRGMVVFPFMVVPLMANEKKQAHLIDEALMKGRTVGIFLQADQDEDNPGPDDIFDTGTSGNIIKMLKFPDGTIRLLVQGLTRIKIKRFLHTDPYLTAEVEELTERSGPAVKLEALQRNLSERLKVLIELAPNLTEELHISAINQETPSKFADLIASNLNISVHEKQTILVETDIYKRMENLLALINKEIEVLELSKKIQSEAKSELGKIQREFILREQLKVIKKELGDKGDSDEIEEFEKRIKLAGMSKVAEEVAFKELDRLSRMNPASA